MNSLFFNKLSIGLILRDFYSLINVVSIDVSVNISLHIRPLVITLNNLKRSSATKIPLVLRVVIVNS